MRRTTLSLLGLLLVGSLPLSASAAAPADAYADNYFNTSFHVYQPQNAVGAPDGVYTDFFAKDANFLLDMGEDEEGLGDLTLHYQLQQNGAQYKVEFLDSEQQVLYSHGNYLPIAETLVVAYPEETPYRYVRVHTLSTNQYRLDAVEAADHVDMTTPEEPVTPPVEEEPPAEEPVESSVDPNQGSLIKLVDDGDAATTHDAAVYVVGAEGKRHAFPNERVFQSWYEDFSGVQEVSAEKMASYALGKNVTMRAGTFLVKLTTDPKTYAVEPGGYLRWVTTEEIAKALYGDKWNERVVDVSDVFFGNYLMGQPIESAVHPDGTVGVAPGGSVVHINNATYTMMSGEVYDYMRFRPNFFVNIKQSIFDLYVDAGSLSMDGSLAFPY